MRPDACRILIVNPNSTSSMTEKVRLAATAVAASSTEIIATNPAGGPASIEGFHDGAMSVPGMLDMIQSHAEVDAVVIACFDDTGLDAARCSTDVPVLGIGEAAFHAATMLSCRFSVVTTLRRSVPGIEANLVRYGLDRRCGRVRASDVPVLALEALDEQVLATLGREVERAIDEDGAEAVVLGCAGMAGLDEIFAERYGIPIVDGVTVATTFAEALVATGLRTSKTGGYAPVRLIGSPRT